MASVESALAGAAAAIENDAAIIKPIAMRARRVIRVSLISNKDMKRKQLGMVSVLAHELNAQKVDTETLIGDLLPGRAISRLSGPYQPALGLAEGFQDVAIDGARIA